MSQLELPTVRAIDDPDGTFYEVRWPNGNVTFHAWTTLPAVLRQRHKRLHAVTGLDDPDPDRWSRRA